MVHMQLGRSNGKLLRITNALVARLDASVIGIAACRLPRFPSEDYFAGLGKHSERELKREISDAEHEFGAALDKQSKKAEWRSTGTSVALADYLADQACSADLVITVLNRGDIELDPSRDANIGDLVTQLGRPILLVPTSEVEIDIGRVLVGWKNTREARRAVLDALPLLKKADHVAVCQMAQEDNLDMARASLSDVTAWLARHRVAAEAHAVLAGEDDAESLSAIAADQAAGIVVAGAFGHSRLRESIFGGVTKTLLERSERCLFLSH